MDVSVKAARRIRQLKSRAKLEPRAGVRLAVGVAGVSLRWEPSGPRPTDMVLKRRGVPIFVEARAYVQLADYELDLSPDGDAPRFLLRHRQIPNKILRRNPV